MRAVRDAGFEVRHPLLGPRALAGQRARSATRALDRRADAAGRRALQRGVRRAARHARRGRLADEPARVRAASSGGLSPTPPTARGATTAASSAPARPAAALGCIQMPTTLPTLDELLGVDRRRRHRSNVAAHLLKHTGEQSARPGLHAARGARRAKARARLRATACRLARAGLHSLPRWATIMRS